ncbi:MAG: UbiA prenyltransferase family protein [candidate division WOR-3 bacterium]|nr:MAG: UbiA prenyltransferase family protein [candidate division WOR-3 bacterium]
MKFFTTLVRYVESTGLKRSLLTVIAWICIRVFFEGVFESTHQIGYIPFSYKSLVVYFLHFPLFYISLFLILVIITALITGEHIRRVTGACASGLGLIILVPLIDWFAGGGYTITYPSRIGPYLLGALNPFISIIDYGGSPGQRIILSIICICLALYSYVKTKKIGMGILLFLASYFIIVIFGGLPTIVAGNRPETVFVTGGILYSDTQKFAAIFLLLSIISGGCYMLLFDREKFAMVLRSLRPERALFYAGMGFFGLFLSLHQQGISIFSTFPSLFDTIGIIVMLVGLAAGFQCAAAFNDFYDLAEDSVTRSRNPLVRGLDSTYYTWWTGALCVTAMLCSLLLNYIALLIMITYLAIGVLYSMPPIRFKRIPIVATFVLAAAVILSMALGYSLITGSTALNQMPRSILLPTLIGITLGFMAKDIHDSKADRVSGVYTVPALFVVGKGRLNRMPVAVIIGFSYLCYALFIKELLWGALVFSAATIIYTMMVRTAKEWVYFVLLYLFGGYLVIIINRLPTLP